MIILKPGIYTTKQIKEMDLGTNGQLPTADNDLIISNPLYCGIPSYRVMKRKDGNKWVFKIEEI